MKKLIIYAIMFLCTVNLSAQSSKGVDFINKSLDEAISMAAQNSTGPKLVFVDCYTSWCVPCKKMAMEEFVKEEAGKYFNPNFINIKIDMEKGDGPSIRKKYGVFAYPTFLIIDGSGKEVARVGGASPISSFIEKVKYAADPSNSPDSLLLSYTKQPNLSSVSRYVDCLERLQRNKEMLEFLSEAYPKLSPMERYDNKLQREVFMALANFDSKLHKFCLYNKAEFDMVFGKSVIDDLLTGIYSNNLIKYVGGKSGTTKESAMEQVRYLQLLTQKNNLNNFICRIAQMYAEGDIKGIESQIEINNVMQSFSPTDQFTVKMMLFSVPGIDKKKITEFYQAEIKFHEGQIKYSNEALKKVQMN